MVGHDGRVASNRGSGGGEHPPAAATGLVVSKQRGWAIVLMPGGEFRRVRAKAEWQVGDQVAPAPERPVGRWASWAAVAAAAAVLGLSLPRIFSAGVAEAAGVVSVDFDGSGVDLTVSKTGRVVAARAFGPAAQAYLKAHQVVGLPAKDVLQQLTQAAVSQGLIGASHPYLVLGTTSATPLLSELAAAEKAWQRQYHWPVAVVTVSGPLPPTVKTAPQKLPVSVGRYLLWLRRHPGEVPPSWNVVQGDQLEHLVGPSAPAPESSAHRAKPSATRTSQSRDGGERERSRPSEQRSLNQQPAKAPSPGASRSSEAGAPGKESGVGASQGEGGQPSSHNPAEGNSGGDRGESSSDHSANARRGSERGDHPSRPASPSLLPKNSASDGALSSSRPRVRYNKGVYAGPAQGRQKGGVEADHRKQ
ncbi:MAG: hypothetical protein K6U87_02230 [Firmicutes bacterium]|nr:hypothetical protein [Bacillota bacterium]